MERNKINNETKIVKIRDYNNPEKWITIKIKAKLWWKIKAKAHKEGRKLNWYVNEALTKYLAEVIDEKN